MDRVPARVATQDVCFYPAASTPRSFLRGSAGRSHPDRAIASRLHAEVGEDRMARVCVRNPKVLRLRAHPAAIDFVFIRGAPVMGRRQFIFRCFLRHGVNYPAPGPTVKADLSEVIDALFTGA